MIKVLKTIALIFKRTGETPEIPDEWQTASLMLSESVSDLEVWSADARTGMAGARAERASTNRLQDLATGPMRPSEPEIAEAFTSLARRSSAALAVVWLDPPHTDQDADVHSYHDEFAWTNSGIDHLSCVPVERSSE